MVNENNTNIENVNQTENNELNPIPEISNKEFFIILLKRFWNTFNWAIITIVVLIFIFKCILYVGFVPSTSMEKTVHKSSFVVGLRLGHNYEIGDILMFYSKESNNILIKRVVGVAGDEVTIKDGCLYRNGTKIDEPYVIGNTYNPNEEERTFNVPDDCLLLFGDNREDSIDARFWENPYISCADVKCKTFASFSISHDEYGTYWENIK